MKNSIKSKVAVIGSGVWGLAICQLLARNGNKVSVLSCFEDEVKEINQKHNKAPFPILASTDFNAVVKEVEFIFVVVPSNAFSSVLNSLNEAKISNDVKITICSKGIEGKNLQLFSDFVDEELPNNHYAILSGPNFASEVSDNLPTTTTIACKNKVAASEIADVLRNKNFLPIISNDIISTQIFGSIKNIFAIGCGMIDGLELGENLRAALIVKGVLEAKLLIDKLGGEATENFISPAGLGDLFLTCSSKKSRNNSLGFAIGSGKKIKEILSKGTTLEGFNAADLMIKFSKKHQVTLPLCEKINQILQGDFSTQEIKTILSHIILSN
ncbi:MAG: glycerol-3-phosphate dehydrogenase (NAD(P)+) [Lentimonas sp.]|jgi:glycerol-3-phosphate dehydrogenase (NAD(P)+)